MAKKKLGKLSTECIETQGTPTAMLLPARNYKFKVFEEQFTITVPRRGKFKDLAPEFYKDDESVFDFLQYDDERKKTFVSLPFISQVLFATAQYPDLKDNQAFIPMALIIEDEKVEIVGKLIEMVQGE